MREQARLLKDGDESGIAAASTGGEFYLQATFTAAFSTKPDLRRTALPGP